MDEMLYIYWKLAKTFKEMLNDDTINVNTETHRFLNKQFNKYYVMYEWNKEEYNDSNL